jgi:hypothetical protein
MVSPDIGKAVPSHATRTLQPEHSAHSKTLTYVEFLKAFHLTEVQAYLKRENERK